MAHSAIKRVKSIWSTGIALLHARQPQDYLQCGEGSDVAAEFNHVNTILPLQDFFYAPLTAQKIVILNTKLIL